MDGEFMALRVREAHFGADAPAPDAELVCLRRSGAERRRRAERSASELAQAWLQKNGPPSVFWEPG
jgi:hypothetical protein